MEYALDEIGRCVGTELWPPATLASLATAFMGGQLGDVAQYLSFVSSDLMWPQNKTFSEDGLDFDFEEQIPADIDRLHSLVLISALRMQFISILATAKAHSYTVHDLDSPTDAELLLVQRRAREDEAPPMIHQLLNDLDSYLVASDSRSLFRRRSEERIRFSWGYPCGGNYPSTGSSGVQLERTTLELIRGLPRRRSGLLSIKLTAF